MAGLQASLTSYVCCTADIACTAQSGEVQLNLVPCVSAGTACAAGEGGEGPGHGAARLVRPGQGLHGRHSMICLIWCPVCQLALHARQVKEAKGLDMVRRDWCGLAKDCGNFALDRILSGQPCEEVVDAIHAKLQEVGASLLG